MPVLKEDDPPPTEGGWVVRLRRVADAVRVGPEHYLPGNPIGTSPMERSEYPRSAEALAEAVERALRYCELRIEAERRVARLLDGPRVDHGLGWFRTEPALTPRQQERLGWMIGFLVSFVAGVLLGVSIR